ncbi:MAG: hypothetical protein DMF87_06615 [Acidobacteria bacterium]|nr:MAG: hypothetical protein DMF87_06615 [Acidobacteriota bacterium]
MGRIFVCVLVALVSTGCEIYAGTPAEGRFDRTLNVSGPVNVEIRTRSGGIRVYTGPANTVRVVGRIRAGGWFDEDGERQVKAIEANPPIRQDAGTIRIGDSSDNGIPQRVSIGYEITVPDTAHVDATAGSGGIRVEGPDADVRAIAGSGGIRLTGVRGPVVARVGSGGIRIEGKPVAGWDLRTGSGGIRMTVADNTPFTLDAQVGSGGIHSDQPVAADVQTRNRLQGSVRGGGARVQVETGSGGIRID